MRFFYMIITAILLVLSAPFSVDKSYVFAAPTDEYIQIIESSCKKSCVGGKDELAFCASYCQCVGRQVKVMAKKVDVVKLLKEPKAKSQIVNRCSGTTAVKFFKNSCQDKCDGAPKCTAYCSCIEQKVKLKRTIAQIGDFFIRLGKNEEKAKDFMKSYEKACEK